jgi:ankyrin repeat protein
LPPAIEIAIKENDSQTVHSVLTGCRPLPVDVPNEASQTGLMIACANNKSCETVKVILDQNPNLSAEDLQGWTALHYAAESGSLECVKLLIEHNAEIDAQTDKKETPLHFAAQNNCYEIVKLLIEHKAEIKAKTDKNETALFLAAKHNHPDIVEFLAENNCHLQAKALYKKPVKYSWILQKEEFTALEVAVQHNFVEITKCLLFHLIRTKELREKELNELLIEAAKNDRTKIANELLINGANVNHQEAGNFTKLDM